MVSQIMRKEDAILGTSHESATHGSGAEERRAAARSSIYGLFQDALTYPDDEVRESLAAGELVELMRKGLALAEVDFTLAEESWRALREVGSAEEIKNSSNKYIQQFIQGSPDGPIDFFKEDIGIAGLFEA